MLARVPPDLSATRCKGVARTYRQYGFLPEKAGALQAWADDCW